MCAVRARSACKAAPAPIRSRAPVRMRERLAGFGLRGRLADALAFPLAAGRYGSATGLTNSSCSGPCAPNYYCTLTFTSSLLAPLLPFPWPHNLHCRPKRLSDGNPRRQAVPAVLRGACGIVRSRRLRLVRTDTHPACQLKRSRLLIRCFALCCAACLDTPAIAPLDAQLAPVFNSAFMLADSTFGWS